jgi:hypothetical protein
VYECIKPTYQCLSEELAWNKLKDLLRNLDAKNFRLDLQYRKQAQVTKWLVLVYFKKYTYTGEGKDRKLIYAAIVGLSKVLKVGIVQYEENF